MYRVEQIFELFDDKNEQCILEKNE